MTHRLRPNLSAIAGIGSIVVAVLCAVLLTGCGVDLPWDSPGRRLVRAIEREDDASVFRQIASGAAGAPDLTDRREVVGYPILAAAAAGRLDYVEAILRTGAPAGVVDHAGRNALHHLAGGGGSSDADRPRIVEILVSAGVPVNALDMSHDTPLSKAAFVHDDQLVRSLIAAGADVSIADEIGYSPLHSAALRTDPAGPAVVAFLLASGADVNATDRDGKRPYDLAVAYGTAEVQALLHDAMSPKISGTK